MAGSVSYIYFCRLESYFKGCFNLKFLLYLLILMKNLNNISYLIHLEMSAASNVSFLSSG
jgi:hypothetical protein